MKKWLAVLFLFLSGCLAGGIFINHKKPDFTSGEIAEVEFELSVNAGNASRAFRYSAIYYWINVNNKKKKKMNLVFSDKERCVFTVDIEVPEDVGGENIYYYFEYACDGQLLLYPEETKPFVCIVKGKGGGKGARVPNDIL